MSDLLTPEQLMEGMAKRYGLTPDELRAKLSEQLTEAAPIESPQKKAGYGKPKPEPAPQVKAAGGSERAQPIEDATDEAMNPEPVDRQDPAVAELEQDPEMQASARLAREERKRLLPEYVKYYFIEDLPPIDPEDPWNQGIYMRFRINQMRYARGEEPVDVGSAPEDTAGPSSAPTDAPPVSPEGQTPAPAPVTPPVTEETAPEAPAGAPA